MIDIATILGIFVGFGCVCFAIMADGGNFGLFFCVPAITIVVGGTFAATAVHFSMGSVMRLASFLKKTFAYHVPSEEEAIQQLVASENPAKPLSDESLMKALADQGIKVARRTIAKYREQLNILPSHLRKTF